MVSEAVNKMRNVDKEDLDKILNQEIDLKAVYEIIYSALSVIKNNVNNANIKDAKIFRMPAQPYLDIFENSKNVRRSVN